MGGCRLQQIVLECLGPPWPVHSVNLMSSGGLSLTERGCFDARANSLWYLIAFHSSFLHQVRGCNAKFHEHVLGKQEHKFIEGRLMQMLGEMFMP